MGAAQGSVTAGNLELEGQGQGCDQNLRTRAAQWQRVTTWPPAPSHLGLGPALEWSAPPGSWEAEAEGGSLEEAMGSGQTPGPRAQVCRPEPGLESQTMDGLVPREPRGQTGEEGRLVPVGGQAADQARSTWADVTHQSCSFTRRPSSRMVVVL